MLEIKHLTKIYKSKNMEIRALDDINLKIQDKGMVFILGKSGSGKSTLLNVLGGLDEFSEGEIIICGKSSQDFKQSDFDSYRNTFVGFIFQEYNVMDNFTVKENIALALQLQGKKADEQIIQDILDEVDLQGLGDRKPNELSGGQLQRVAIARALIKQPEIIMADEPTGALDSRTGQQVFDTLKKLSKEKLVLIVSHDKEFAKNYADRIIELSDGKIISDTSKEHIAPQKMNEGISFIENEFINIDNTHELSDADIKKIIQEIKKHQGETIISFNQHTNKEIKKTNHIDEDGRLEVFHDTTDKHMHIKDYVANTVTFIQSKLPFQSSMKLALSHLKLKPFRLFMTIILSVVSFTLFGLTNTMSQYNKETATYHSIKDSHIDYLSIGKTSKVTYDSYSYEEDSKLNQNDIQTIQKKYSNIPFVQTFSKDNFGVDLSFTQHIHQVDKLPTDETSLFYSTAFSAFSELNQDMIDKNNFTLLGKLPSHENEIVVTELFAKTFQEYGYQIMNNNKTNQYPIHSSKDLIGKTIKITLNSNIVELKICGILDTHLNLERFEPLKNKDNKGISQYYLSIELSQLLSRGYHALGFVHPNLLQDCINNYHAYSTRSLGKYMDIALDDTHFNSEYFYNDQDIDKNQIIDFKNKGNIYVNYHSIKNLRINNTTTLQDIINQQITNPTNEKETIHMIKKVIEDNKDVIIHSNFKLSLSTDTFLENIIDKIAGVYIDNLNVETHAFVLTDACIQKYQFQPEGFADFMISSMPDDTTLKDVIAYTYDDGIDNTNYILANQVMPMLTNVNSIVDTLQSVFFYIGIGFALFAAVMFCNFIATSIANKKRELGILRAVGARGRDVFKIFLNESLMIAGMNWLLAVIACFIATFVINQFVRHEFGLLVTVLNFGILQIVLLFLISVSVACIASAIPVYKISKMRPIDAIKDRK